MSMTVSLENDKGEEFDISVRYTKEFTGRGHWDIFCWAEYKGKNKKVRTYTNDSEFIDSVKDMVYDQCTFEDIQALYHQKFFEKDFEEILLEWFNPIF